MNGTSQEYPAGSYAPVNGLNLYYEKHGTGRPLVLLHGGLGSTGMFGALLPLLAKSRQVIAVDLQAHGRTADIDRPIRLELMADDIAALIEHIGLEKVDLMGYSMGGGGKRDAGWDGAGMSNARLAILPGTTHYNVFFSPALAPTVTPFLDAPMLDAA
jgi:pimeloyl-ACP methyl ester carboxylesterase